MTAPTGSTMLLTYESDGPTRPLRLIDSTSHLDEIRGALASAARVGLERWRATSVLPAGADEAAVLEAYREEIDRLMARGGYRTADVVRVHPEHPDRVAMREKFLEEHVHADDEVRFFVEGTGAFYIRAAERVLQLIVSPGDLVVVPAQTRHWFDMGPSPRFAAIRLFTSPDGWVASFTGDDIARRTPRFEHAP